MNSSKRNPIGPDQKHPRGLEYAALAFAGLAALYLCVRWVAGYETGDYDDKAVHYYSAARLYAAPDARRVIDQNQSAWLDHVPVRIRYRTENRLRSYGVYPLPSSLLRAWCEAYRAPGQAPRSFSLPFRNAAFLAHLLALALILCLAWRFAISGSVVMLVLVAASLPSLHPEWLAPLAHLQPHHLQSGPRDSAILVLVAACFAFVQRQWLMAILGLLLVFAWHAGAGLIGGALAATSLALCHLGVSGHRRGKGVLLGVLLALAVLATPLLEWRELLRLWVPLAVIGYCSTTGRTRLSLPLLQALLVTASFLYLSQGVDIVFRLPRVEHGLIYMENHLVGEVPDRLEGMRQVAAVALVALLFGGFARAVLLRRAAPRVHKAALLVANTGLLLIAVWMYRGVFPALASGDLPFFAESDAHINRVPLELLSPESREALGENAEAAFFVSLGDFLICYGE